MNNKKGQGTASSYLIATFVSLGVLVAIGLMVTELTNTYGVDKVTYFGDYDDYYTEVSEVGQEFTSSLDEDEERIEEGDSGLWSRFKKTIDITRFEDNMFFKTLKAIAGVPKLIGSIQQGVEQLALDLKIPSIFIKIVITVLGISLIALLLQVIRGVRHV